MLIKTYANVFSLHVRKRKLAIAMTVIVLALLGVVMYMPASAYAEEVSTEDMYRMYNPNSGEHFYTASTAERDDLSDAGWNYEGIGWCAPKTSNTPVYRMYNPNPGSNGSGEHHYTTSTAERDMLIAVGWNYEGIGWYSDDDEGVPLYRQYNPNAFNCNHNYTTSESENDWLVSLGWKAESIGWYGHTHNWVAQTVHHDAVTHEETVYTTVHHDAQYQMVCNSCDYVTTSVSDKSAHAKEKMLEGDNTHTFSEKQTQAAYDEKVATGTKTVVDQAAYDETVTTGYKCSTCGATK